MGTVTLDAAYYDYDGYADNPISIYVGLLLNNEIDIIAKGRPRPYVRYIKDGLFGDETAFGVQHVINGHKASITLEIAAFWGNSRRLVQFSDRADVSVD